MGIFNSSKTRVRPIFTELSRSDPLGRPWLSNLMKFGGKSPSIDPGNLIVPPLFEFPASPPRAFLAWLANNPKQLKKPKYSTSLRTQEKREALIDGDQAVSREALEAIKDPQSNPHGKWWCFEGTTMVDCALITRNMVLFIEGKRTEIGSSENVSWYSGRDQVLRNLECARQYGDLYGLDYYAMLIIEGEDKSKELRAEQVASADCVRASLPHLSEQERELLMLHYLGFTTWKKLVDDFDLPKTLLKEGHLQRIAS